MVVIPKGGGSMVGIEVALFLARHDQVCRETVRIGRSGAPVEMHNCWNREPVSVTNCGPSILACFDCGPRKQPVISPNRAPFSGQELDRGFALNNVVIVSRLVRLNRP